MMDWRWTEVDSLESQGKWNEAKSLLIKSWNQNPSDLKTVFDLVFLLVCPSRRGTFGY
jgi:hypothetical protein